MCFICIFIEKNAMFYYRRVILALCHVCVTACNVYRLSRCGCIILHPRLNWVCAIRFRYVGYLWSGIFKISCFHRAGSSCKSQNLFSRCCIFVKYKRLPENTEAAYNRTDLYHQVSDESFNESYKSHSIA